MRALLAEGGGSRTWAALVTDGQVASELDWGCTSERSIGARAAASQWRGLVGSLLAPAGRGRRLSVAVAHGWACLQSQAERLARLLTTIVAEHGYEVAAILVTNDLVPLLICDDAASRDPAEIELVVVAGTGTGYLARRGPSWSRASGLEYVLSDEGGGFDLGLRGLRAVVRALDGRGPATGLVSHARHWAGSASGDLPEALFALAYGRRSKFDVASFAEMVLTAAQEGDEVAAGLLDASRAEIVSGARAVVAALAPDAGRPAARLTIDGSLLTRWPTFRASVVTGLAQAVALSEVIVVTPELRRSGVHRLFGQWQDGTLRPADLAPGIPCFLSRL